MRKKLGAPIAVVLLIVPALACSLFRPKPSYKWRLTLEIDPSISNREGLVHETVEALKNRLDRYGLSSFSVEVSGKPEAGRVRVNLPEVTDPDRIKNFISSQGLLQIVHIVSESSPVPLKTYGTKEQGQAALGNSSANINEYLGVVLNNEVKSIAYIKSQITDTGQITGRFTKESAEDLSLMLSSGPLPAPVKTVEEGSN